MEVEKTERTAKMVVILGANGTGKTTILKNILNQSHDKSLVIAPDVIGWEGYPEVDLDRADDFLGAGIRTHIFDDRKKGGTLDKIEYFKKGNLVFDDCRAYFTDKTDSRIHKLIIRRRQRMVDIFAVGHGFNEVPPKFFTFATEIILFRTTDNIARRKNCLKDFNVMVKAQERVNRMAKKNPHYFEVVKFT
jgi:ABC-type sugar transport system ATPase subunit